MLLGNTLGEMNGGVFWKYLLPGTNEWLDFVFL
jgi:hypothetical protein